MPRSSTACSTDGHTTMLLGVAGYLAETKNFDGIVHFIFQPAEENECGRQKMVQDGLFERFPVESVFRMHNWPDVPVGAFGVRAGPIMADNNKFEFTIGSRGAHAAMPHLGDALIVAACAMVDAIQTIVSRTTSLRDEFVVSITQIHGGNTWNIVPEEVALRGTCCHFRPELREILEAALVRISEGIASTHGVRTSFSSYKPIPPAANADGPTAQATWAAAMVADRGNVQHDVVPSMGCEDLGFMLAARPGDDLWIGNGPLVGGIGLHSSRYNFNDKILPLGASYWVRLVETVLPRLAAG